MFVCNRDSVAFMLAIHYAPYERLKPLFGRVIYLVYASIIVRLVLLLLQFCPCKAGYSWSCGFSNIINSSSLDQILIWKLSGALALCFGDGFKLSTLKYAERTSSLNNVSEPYGCIVYNRNVEHYKVLIF